MASKKNRGLGTQLTDMFGVKSVAEVFDPKQNSSGLMELPISRVQPGKYQARTGLTDEDVEDLVESVKDNGLVNPVTVRKIESGDYEILAGERRYRAACVAGLKKIPVNIVDVDDKGALVIGLIENIQREDLNAIDAAQGIKRLMEEFTFTHAEAAKAIGRSRPYVTNLIRLLALPPQIQEYLKNGELDAGHARALLPLTTEQQLKLSELIIAKGLSVRQTEELAANVNNPDKSESHQIKKTELPSSCDSWATQFGATLGSKVRVKATTGGKGKKEIYFNS
ncbi:MAG: ParB/RepB/Spo0J family partition protein, partial [Burkholderiales bacterium]|nr:ParB/RepB/Spo0J family partition protein [Burkholderiales bacterium]